jgi:predicted nucleic-acid-binding protein
LRVVDTNLVVRLLVDDDRSQADRAQEIIETGDILLLNSVILETAWVLRSLYRLPPTRIASILRGLIGLPGVALESAQTVAKALDWFEAGLDFADAMHLAATPADAEFVTFDQALVRDAAKLVGTPWTQLA